MRYPQSEGKKGMRFETAVILVFFLLPGTSIQELSHLPHASSSSGHGERQRQGAPFQGTPNFPKEALNDDVRSSLNLPIINNLAAASATGNVSLNDLADNINRLEGNLASLIQSFLALQRSVFNLEQLQELLVLLLEDILKQTGNLDRSTANDVDRATGASSASDDSDDADDGDDGVDSAEIDETGEDTGEDNGDRARNGGDDNANDRSAGADGTGGGGQRGGLNKKDHQGSTDPFDTSNKGMLRETSNRQRDGTENRRFRNQIRHDSDEEGGGGSSEDAASAASDEDGGASGGGGRNSVLSKGASPNKAPPASPRKPQLSEPMMSMSAQLEARLNDLIRRLNPDAMMHGGSPQRLSHIRAISDHHQEVEHQHPQHQGESPLAPRPIFEPLEVVVAGSAEISSPVDVDGKVAIRSQGVRVKERMPVVSHGGPLMGPEDFSSSFMERLDVVSSKGNLNEHSNGMISNLMQKTPGPVDHSGLPGPKETQQPKVKAQTTPSAMSSQDQIQQSTNPTSTTTPASTDDFDQMIANLLRDLGHHLRKQRAYHDDQSRTTDILDKAVVQLSKLTWIQMPPENNSSKLPEYIIHTGDDVPASQAMELTQYSDLHNTESKSDDGAGDSGTVDSMGVAADRVLSTRVPNAIEYNWTTPLVENHESTVPVPQETTVTKLGVDRSKHVDENTQGPWDWLRHVESISPESDYSLTLLIKLLSELSSEEHNTSKELAVFSDTGQKLAKDIAHSENPHVTAADRRDRSEMADVYGDNSRSESERLNNQNGYPDDGNSVGSLDDDSSEDVDENYETKGRLHHMNDVLSDDTNTEGDSNNINNYNETGSSSSEEDYRDENSSNESDDDDDDLYQANGNKVKGNNDPSQDKADHDNNAPFDLDSTRPTQMQVSFNKNEPMLHGGINEVTNSKYEKKPTHKEQIGEMNNNEGHNKENKDRFYEDELDEEQSKERDSEENETHDSEDSDVGDYDYLSGQNTYQETQLFGPPIPEDHSEASYTSHRDISPLTAYANHVISKRNTKTAPFPDSFILKSSQGLHQSPMSLSRKKRQADIFWQQFLGLGSSPIGQQKMPAPHGPQSHGNAQSLSNHLGQQLHQGQGHLQGLAPQQNQNGFHTPLQFPNQQNHIGSPQGQGPLQYPIPPFRGYPQYSRYNNYLGFSYPNFGYPGYPGYHGMNHEPGESPAFEGGPSADFMEEVLTNLFQRYWENVRNMFTTRGPLTTPENEYEGPITTPPPTAAPITTSVKTTTVAATTKMPVTKASTTPQPLSSMGTSMAPPLVDTTNTTGNTTNINTTDTQIAETQPTTSQGSLAVSSSLASLDQALPRSTTDKNTVLPLNLFPRKIHTKTSPFPFF